MNLDILDLAGEPLESVLAFSLTYYFAFTE